MSGFLAEVEQFFGTSDLYQVLGVHKTSKEDDLKRAYRKKALLFHPDRVSEEKDEATKKFQILGKVYSILNDKDRRAVYDEEGTVDEDDDILTQDRDWGEYWRLLFRKVTVDDIKEFEKKYKGSEDEMEDLKQAYIESEGDMDHILETVMCCSFEDEPRYHDIIKQWIKDGSIESYDFLSKETKVRRRKRQRHWEKEAVEAEEALKESGGHDHDGSEESLKALIKSRQQSREREMDGFLDNLAAKYAPKAKKSKNSTAARKGKFPKKK
jgi:DnaJ family protein C protein 9